jgi:hypothetical protein
MQPQQVTQGQQQVLLFAGLFLARRQQFPIIVQVSWLLRWFCMQSRQVITALVLGFMGLAGILSSL